MKPVGLGIAAIGVSIAVWALPAHGDPWAVIALSALRLLAVVIVVGVAVVAVLARRDPVEDDRPVVLERV